MLEGLDPQCVVWIQRRGVVIEHHAWVLREVTRLRSQIGVQHVRVQTEAAVVVGTGVVCIVGIGNWAIVGRWCVIRNSLGDIRVAGDRGGLWSLS